MKRLLLSLLMVTSFNTLAGDTFEQKFHQCDKMVAVLEYQVSTHDKLAKTNDLLNHQNEELHKSNMNLLNKVNASAMTCDNKRLNTTIDLKLRNVQITEQLTASEQKFDDLAKRYIEALKTIQTLRQTRK